MDNPEPTPAKRKKGLTKKLVLSMLLVGALPLIIGLLLAFYQGTQEIREVNGSSFEALATETARKLDLVMADEIARTALLTTDIQIIEKLEHTRDALSELTTQELALTLKQEQEAWNTKDADILQRILKGPFAEVLQKHVGGTFIDPGHPIPVITRSATRGLYITDHAGRVVASLDSDIPYLHREEAWWKGAFHNGVGQPYIGQIAFDSPRGVYTFTLALPIMDSLRYEAIGVLHRIYDAKEFFAPSIDIIRFGKTGHVMLIDSRGVVLSCPILPTGTTISDTSLIPLVTPLHAGWTPAPSDGHGGTAASIIGFAPLSNTNPITQISTGQTWHMFVWQSSGEVFAPIEHFFKWTAAFGLLGVILLVTLGYIAANRISAPIRRLQEAAQQIGRGEYREPLTLSTGDEIEELADEVNRMNQQLASQFAGLESQVELKTQEVKYLEESTIKILDNVPDPVLMIGPDEHIEYLNKASKEAFAVTNGEIIGTPLFQIFSLDPATQNRLKQEMHAVQVLEPPYSDNTNTKPSNTSLQDPLVPTNWAQSSANRQEIRINQRTFRYRWFGVQARPGRGPSAGLVLRDTTEESILQDRVIQGEKLASLGVLSAGIGHELNNPLVGVIGLGEAIQEETNPEQIKEYARGIVQHGKRMASVVRDFTGQSGKNLTEGQTLINLNELLEQSLTTVKDLFPSVPVDIQTHLGPIPSIQGKALELGQVFTNIITNAFQAMQQGGKLDISTETSGHDLEIRIKDTGPGIAATHLPRVFDPFFTTRGQGEGSGLGLTVAYRIINKLGGHIRMESEEKQGTTCLITLPVSNAHLAKERSTVS
ncbi:MAG: HAMP domain-containing protein [Nitrospira sp.]|nr:HAMP domain-containing protein [Nitrospira sp.]